MMMEQNEQIVYLNVEKFGIPIGVVLQYVIHSTSTQIMYTTPSHLIDNGLMSYDSKNNFCFLKWAHSTTNPTDSR